MPTVSVLMCVYNGERHLPQAVESILEQTFQDFELIIVDDGSTDATSVILESYAEKDSRISIVHNEKNVGLERSLNIGLSAVSGYYIARQDADDVSKHHRLALQIDFLNSHPKVGAIGTAVEYIDEYGNVTGQDCLPEDHESLQSLLLFNNFMHHSTLMMRQSLMKELDGYDETKRYAEDHDLWWRISRISKLSSLATPLLYRRLDDGPRISKLYRRQQLECSFEISLSAVRDCLEECPFDLDANAYRRWWWAYLKTLDAISYQKFWVDTEPEQTLLSRKDIESLQPFWDLLASTPTGAQVSGSRLQHLAQDIFQQGRFFTGLDLLKVVVQQMHTSVQWKRLAKSIALSFKLVSRA